MTRANQILSNKILFTLAITAFNNQPFTITCFHQIKSENIKHRYHGAVFIAIPPSFDGAHASVKRFPVTTEYYSICGSATHSLLFHKTQFVVSYSEIHLLNSINVECAQVILKMWFCFTQSRDATRIKSLQDHYLSVFFGSLFYLCFHRYIFSFFISFSYAILPNSSWRFNCTNITIWKHQKFYSFHSTA